MLEEVTLDLTKPQMEKLVKFKPVKLSKSRLLRKKGLPLQLPKDLAMKILNSRMKGKGCVLKLRNNKEIEGSGLLDFLKSAGKVIEKGAQKAAKFYRDELREDLGPLLKNIAEKGTLAGTQLAGTIPYVGSDIAEWGRSEKRKNLTDRLGRKAGLWTEGQGLVAIGAPRGSGLVAIGGGMVPSVGGMVPSLDDNSYYPLIYNGMPLVPIQVYSATPYRGYGMPNSNVDSFV